MYRWIAFPLAAALAGGCQSYRAEPLDPDLMLTVWRDRSIALDTSEPASQPAAGTPRTLSLSDAEDLALVFNPHLRRARLEANVTRVGADEAGRWEDPSLGIDIERIVSGADEPWVVGGLINLTLPLSGRLGIEKQLALVDADLATMQAFWQERQTLADLRRTWVEWSVSAETRRTLEQAIRDLAAIESSARKLVDAAEIDPADARLFAIDLARRRVQLLNLDRDLARIDARLRQIVGLTPEARVTFEAHFDHVDVATDSHADGAGPVDLHPRLQIARLAYAVAERSLELEIRRQYPDLQIGGGFGTDTGDQRVLGGLSVPLPLLNANRRQIAETQARRDVARAAYEQELLDVTSSRVHAQRDVRLAMKSLEMIDRDLVPLVDRQVSEARQLLEVGEFNASMLRDAIDAATDVRIDLHSARGSLLAARIAASLLAETVSPNAQASS